MSVDFEILDRYLSNPKSVDWRQVSQIDLRELILGSPRNRPLGLENLPLLLQVWCEEVLSVNVQQETAQMMDKNSPFRGFGMFGVGLVWDSDLVMLENGLSTQDDPHLELRGDRVLLDCFATDGGKLQAMADPNKIDAVFEGDEGLAIQFSDLLRLNASWGGYSRLRSAATAPSPFAPKGESIPSELPLEVDF